MGSRVVWFWGGFSAAVLSALSGAGFVRGGDGEVARWVVEEQRGSEVLYAEFSIESAEVWRELDDVSAMLREAAGVEGTGGRVEIVLFASQGSYLRYLQRGLPQARSRRALYFRNGEVSQIYAWKNRMLMTDLRHEMVHARVHQHLPFAPLWLDEGLAECFEERVGSRVDVSRRELLRWKARVGQVSTLEALERIPSAESMDGDDYRNSWAWVSFLVGESEESRRALRGYVEEIHRGEAPGAFSVWAESGSPGLLSRGNSYFRKMPLSLSFGSSFKQGSPGH